MAELWGDALGETVGRSLGGRRERRCDRDANARKARMLQCLTWFDHVDHGGFGHDLT